MQSTTWWRRSQPTPPEAGFCLAYEGALEALASSRPGPKAEERDIELKAARADAVRLGEALKEMAVKLMLVEGKKRALGLSSRVPGRVDEATKAGLLDLLDVATDAGWSWRGACRELELGEVRAGRGPGAR